MMKSKIKLIGEHEGEYRTDEEISLEHLLPYEVGRDLRDGKLVGINELNILVGHCYIPSSGEMIKIMKKEDYERTLTGEQKARMEEFARNAEIVANRFGELCKVDEYKQYTALLEERGLHLWDYKLEEVEKMIGDKNTEENKNDKRK